MSSNRAAPPRQLLIDTLFYALERAIKTYRQFAQTRFAEAGTDVTIDQWLVLKTLQDHPTVTQQQIGVMVFKDFASITRIIHLLVAKKLVRRATHARDRRRSALALTRAGRAAIQSLEPVVRANRRQALRGVAVSDATRAQRMLRAIAANCAHREPR